MSRSDTSGPPHAAAAGSVFVGGGPAGLAPLVKAARDGTLAALAAAGLTIVEQGPEIGAGALAEHAIGSDTLADTFLECLVGGAEPRLSALAAHEVSQRLASWRGGSAPLPVVASFLRVLGRAMHEILLSHGARVLTRHAAVQSQRLPEGGWCTRIVGPDGIAREINSERLVLATGAAQSLGGIEAELIGGRRLLPEIAGKIMLSGDALAVGGAARIARRLLSRPQPRVAIIGGSHSALACANLLLGAGTGVAFAPGAVSLLHRRALRIFYPSAEAAIADGYTDFSAADICPLTQRLFRLAGFRLEARTLVCRILGIGDAAPEPRLRVHRLAGERQPDPEAWRILEQADLVIPAFGYRPRALRLLDAQGGEILLAAHDAEGGPLVDRRCRVLDHRRQPVPWVFALGLAAGFVPSGTMGGEPSFAGQTNGLWLWQNDIGAMIVQHLLERESDDVAA